MTATCRADKRSGGNCRRPAGWGTPHPGFGRCKLHLGSTGPHLIHAEPLRVEDETAKIAATYGMPREVDVPGALLELLHAQAGIVDLWDGLVRELDDLSEPGVGGSVEIHRYVRSAERARRDYTKIATDCARLGIEARRAALDRQNTEILIEVIEGTVRRLGADPTAPAVRAEISAALQDAADAAELAIEAGPR